MSEASVILLDHMLGPIRSLLDNPDTEECVVNSPGAAFVFQRGSWHRHTIDLDYDALYDIAILAGAFRRQDVGEAAPLLGGELPRGERFQFVIPPCVPQGTASLTIRIPGSSVAPISSVTDRYKTEGWNRWEKRSASADHRAAALLSLYHQGDIEQFFREAVRSKLNILLCGATGSGKTTMSRTLAECIPAHDRVITVEDALELVVPQPNHVRLLYSASYQEGQGVGPDDLLKAALRMRPDRVMLQELRDPAAAWTYVSAVNTGHPGSLTTIHGATAEQAFSRLFDLCKGSENGRSFDDPRLMSFLSKVVDLIVPFRKEGDLFVIGQVWCAAEAARRGESAADLLN